MRTRMHASPKIGGLTAGLSSSSSTSSNSSSSSSVLCLECLSIAVGICDPSPNVERATKNTTLATGGSVVLYECDTGYKFTDATNATITCDGQNWSPIESACQGNSQPFSQPTTTTSTTLPSSRHRLNYDDCLVDKREDYQNCSVLCCEQQLYTVIRTYMSSF